MTDAVDPVRRAGRWVFSLPIAVSLYAAIILAPNRFPILGTSIPFFFYVLSVGAVALALSLVVLVAALALFWARARQHQPSPVLRGLLIAAGLSLIGVAAVAALARIIPSGLPAGSLLATFDSVAWRQPASAEFVDGDVTVRQKMLGDLVKNLLPGRTRAELEAILGPSLDTPYFKESGSDLIYVLGPQRDSFFPIDSEWLLIWVDSSERFERYAIYTD